MASSGHIYTGRWTDHSYRYPWGETVTLSNSDGNVVIAITSIFATIVSARLWSLVSFVIHQRRCKNIETDGFFRQQQVLLRNPQGPFGFFTKMLALGWAWRATDGEERIPKLMKRTLLMALPALVFGTTFIAISVLVSRVAAGDHVKIAGGYCGIMANDAAPANQEYIYPADLKRTALAAQSYSQQCYTNNTNLPACKTYPVQSLPYTVSDDSCPFGTGVNGQSMCISTPIRLETEILSSDTHFGINAVSDDRILFQKTATCAPINITQYKRVERAIAGNLADFYYLGPYGEVEYSFSYALIGFPNYQGLAIGAISYIPDMINASFFWTPIAPLRVADRTTSVVYLMQNALDWATPVDDPFYAAHGNWFNTSDRFSPDANVTALGCVEGYKICDPRTSPPTCSGYSSSNFSALSYTYPFSDVQNVAVAKLWFSSADSSIQNIIAQLSTRSLLAQDHISYYSMGTSLPPTQWRTEVESWFATGLAILQSRIVQFSANTPALGTSVGFFDWSSYPEPAFSGSCAQQRLRSGFEHQNFSFTGLMLIYSAGFAVVLVSYLAEPCVELKRRRWRSRNGYRELARVEDRLLQLHARAYSHAGYGAWQDTDADVPVTKRGTSFPPLSEIGGRDSTMKHGYGVGKGGAFEMQQGFHHRAESQSEVEALSLHGSVLSPQSASSWTMEPLVQRDPARVSDYGYDNGYSHRNWY